MVFDRQTGQVWSVDVIVGVIIFLSVLGIFYQNLSSTQRDSSPESLEASADTMLTQFQQEKDVQIITDEGVLNRSKLENLSQQEYQALKDELNVPVDFCLYVKDADGNLMKIGNKYSIGNGTLNVSGTECGSTT